MSYLQSVCRKHFCSHPCLSFFWEAICRQLFIVHGHTSIPTTFYCFQLVAMYLLIIFIFKLLSLCFRWIIRLSIVALLIETLHHRRWLLNLLSSKFLTLQFAIVCKNPWLMVQNNCLFKNLVPISSSIFCFVVVVVLSLFVLSISKCSSSVAFVISIPGFPPRTATVVSLCIVLFLFLYLDICIFCKIMQTYMYPLCLVQYRLVATVQFDYLRLYLIGPDCRSECSTCAYSTQHRLTHMFN